MQHVAIDLRRFGGGARRRAAETLDVGVGAAPLGCGGEADAPPVVAGGQLVFQGELRRLQIVARQQDALEVRIGGKLKVVGGGFGAVRPLETYGLFGGELARCARKGRLRAGVDDDLAFAIQAFEPAPIDGPHAQVIVAIGEAILAQDGGLGGGAIRVERGEAGVGGDLRAIAHRARDRLDRDAERHAVDARGQAAELRCRQQAGRGLRCLAGCDIAAGAGRKARGAAPVLQRDFAFEGLGTQPVALRGGTEIGTAHRGDGCGRVDAIAPAATTDRAHRVLDVPATQLHVQLLRAGRLQASDLAQRELGVGADQAAAAVGKFERQAAVFAAADHRARLDLHAAGQWRDVFAELMFDLAAYIHDVRARALAPHPGHGHAQHGARQDGLGVEDLVVVLDARPVVDVLEVALGDVPGVVARAHDIDEILCEGRGSADGEGDACEKAGNRASSQPRVSGSLGQHGGA